MNRHEVPGADERQHQLQLLLAAMPRDVDVLDPLVNDVGAATSQVVDDPSNRLLVPGDRPRRQHHCIVAADLHVTMIVDGDAR